MIAPLTNAATYHVLASAGPRPDEADVTIAITNWNYGQFLTRALLTANAQTLRTDWYVVDDGSDDESEEVYDLLHPSRVIRQGRQGALAAKNRCLEECRTGWIAQLDADDELLPFFAERMLCLCRIEQTDWGYCAFGAIDEKGRGDRYYPAKVFNANDLLTGDNHINTSALCRTEVVRKVGGWQQPPKGVFDDHYLWRRMTAAGHFPSWTPEVLMNRREHGHSLCSGRGFL